MHHLDLLVHDPEEFGGPRCPEDALEIALGLVLEVDMGSIT